MPSSEERAHGVEVRDLVGVPEQVVERERRVGLAAAGGGLELDDGLASRRMTSTRRPVRPREDGLPVALDEVAEVADVEYLGQLVAGAFDDERVVASLEEEAQALDVVVAEAASDALRPLVAGGPRPAMK